VRVQDHPDCASRVYIKDLDGFIGATAQNYIGMKSVDSGETGYLLRSLLMKDFYQFVLVVRLVSFHVIFLPGVNVVLVHVKTITTGYKNKLVHIIKLCLDYFLTKRRVILDFIRTTKFRGKVMIDRREYHQRV